MSKGWRISFGHNGQQKILMMAIADQQEATEKIATDYPGSTNLMVLPFKDGDFERYAMHEGQVIEVK